MSIILSFGTRTHTHNAVVWVLFCSNLHIFRTGGLTTSFCRITLVWWDRYWQLILCWVFCFWLFGGIFWVGNRNRFFDFCDDNSVQCHFFVCFISSRSHRIYNTVLFWFFCFCVLGTDLVTKLNRGGFWFVCVRYYWGKVSFVFHIRGDVNVFFFVSVEIKRE